MKNKINSISAFDAAANYLSYKDRSSTEIYKKLIDKGYSEEETENAIDKLIEYGYVNDYKYVVAYVKANQNTKGKRLISYDLVQKGISKDIIDEALSAYEVDEASSIDCIFCKRFSDVNMQDDKQYRRVYNYFLRRGYSYNVLSEILTKYRKTD